MTDPDQLPALPASFIASVHALMEAAYRELGTEDPFYAVLNEARAAIATERARADALRAELGESDAVRERLAELLKQTAVALRGEPPPLTSWSWHDVPERAAAAIAAIDVMQRAASINAERADALEAALKPLAALGLYALDETRGDYIGSDLSGGDIQDKAEALGLLTRVEVKDPCSEEYCSCAEYYDKDEWPVQCLQNSPLIAAARALLEKKT